MTDIIESITNTENLTQLLQALEISELTETLKTPGSYTIFAPTDEAFAQLPDEILNLLSEDLFKLKRISAYHIGFGDIRKQDLLQIQEVETMEGSIIAVNSSSEQIKLNNANVVNPDIIVDNGVIHFIDQVLIPTLVLSE